MRIFKRTASILLMIVLLVCINPMTSVAAGGKVDLVDMHSIASDHVKEYEDDLTDSYGNKYYSNILEFEGDEYPYIIYDLNGKYSQFDANIVCSEDTSSGSSFYVGIFVDGELKYELDGYNKRKDKESLTIDVAGAGQLAIKVADINDKWDGYLYFVQSSFTKADQASNYPTRFMLNDTFRVDASSDVGTSTKLFVDPLGKVHNGYIELLDVYTGSSKKTNYIIYNLDKKYARLSGTVLVGKWTGSAASSGACTVKIYLDDELVFEQKFTKDSSGVSFDYDVSNRGIIKITATSESIDSFSANYTSPVYITDTILKTHEHTPGEWQTVKEPTCTEPGKKELHCSECDIVLETETIPAKGHKADGLIVTTVEATCSHTGTKVQHCSVCGAEMEKQTIEKLPHTPSSDWETVKEPTCVETGLRQKVCEVCGEVLEKEIIEVEDHTFGSWEAVSGSMWEGTIVEERECTECGFKETRENTDYAWFKPAVIAACVLVVIVAGVVVFLVIHLKKKAAAKKYLQAHPVSQPAEPVTPPAAENFDDAPAEYPSEPSEPVQYPVAPVAPVVPAVPVAPVAPVVPAVPDAPAAPVTPTIPVIPTIPSENSDAQDP